MAGLEVVFQEVRFWSSVQQDLFRVEKMAFNGLRLEYALEGTSNFFTWKDHMEAVLDDNGLL